MAGFDALPLTAQLPILMEVAVRATQSYALPPGLQVDLINLSENATYRVEAPDGRRWALRVHRDGYHSRVAIASELAWLMALRDNGVVVTPRPVAGRDGEVIQVVGHDRLPRPRHVVLSDWEAGIEPGIDTDLNDPEFRRYQHWADRRMESLIQRMQKKLKGIKPEVALVTWTTNAGRFARKISPRTAAPPSRRRS